MIAASIDDYREMARRRLPRFLFDYIDGGAFGEQTLRGNIEDLANVCLRQRVLRDVSTIDLSTVLFGAQQALPIALAPIGLAGMNARRGERQAARAAEAAGVPFTLSTVGVCSIRELRENARAPFWFQLYMIRDRGFMSDLLEQVRAASCGALILTVDMPLPGTRYRDLRSGLAGAPGLCGQARRLAQALVHPNWAWDVGLRGGPHHLGNVAPVLAGSTGIEDFFAWMRANFDPSVTWKDLDWVRSRWNGPLILKGVLDVEDAENAVRLGAEGLVVSNHGGRQLDGAISSARALPRIADAVGDRLVVLADGGVRSGLDVARLLALGAKGVMIGRAWAYALGARGQAGVAHMLEILASELRVAMALTGAVRIEDLDCTVLDSLPGEQEGHRKLKQTSA